MSNEGGMILGALGRLAWSFAFVASAVACSSAHAPQATDSIAAVRSEALVTATITLQTPKDVPVLSPVVIGAQAVTLSASAKITGTTVAMGSAGLTAEPDIKANDIWSRGLATLKDRDNITGVVHAASVSRGSNVIISGGIDSAPVFDPPAKLTWNVAYPTGTASNIAINSGVTQTLAPGLYGTVTVNSGGTLNLSSGTYYLTTFGVEAAGKVNLDQANGPVIIYETSSLILRGPIVAKDGSPPDLLLAHLGTAPVYVEAVFNGAIIAPNSALSLRRVNGTHTGYFYGKTVANLDGAVVQYRSPAVIAQAAGLDVEECARQIVPPPGLTGRALQTAYQTLLTKYCTMPNTSTGMTTLVGRANADYSDAAKQYIAKVRSAASYLALSRDRNRKYHAAESDPAKMTELTTQPDDDMDWVVNSKDRCPNTPDLTATDDNGCPLTTLPQVPDDAAIRAVLATFGVMFNPRCVDAAPPAEAAGAAIFQSANPGNGLFIVATRVTNQPAGCPIWYMFQIREMPATGQALHPYLVSFKDSEQVLPIGGLSQLPNVPDYLIQFNAKTTDPTTRARLAQIPVKPLGVNFRVQAVNGNGQRGPWSEWKIPSQLDCVALGVVCGVRH
jgi:hypothetical protein